MRKRVTDMLKFALKNMAVKRVQIILIVISIVISAGVAVLAYNTSRQVSDGISGNAGYYSAIIGPSGSKTQLAMNTMYFTDEPLGTIPYEILSELKADMRVTSVIPYAMADSYNGYSVVGTSSEYLSGKNVASGRMFDDGEAFEIVLGSTVARVCGASVGDEIYTSHAVGEVHKHPMKVVGILEETHTSFDRVVFTQIKTIWEVHEEEEEEEHEDHDHEEMNGMVCAILVKAKNPSYAMLLVNEYNGKIFTSHEGESYSLSAIEPMSAVRGVLEEADNTKYIVFVLCAIILRMNIIIISIITLLGMISSKKEIALMRLIGISMKKINLLYILQNGIIGFVSTVLALGTARLCSGLMGEYVASMGVVLDASKIYPAEIAILAGVFLISILPTFVCTLVLSHRDGVES